MSKRDFLSLSDAGGEAVAAMLSDAIDRKAARATWPKGSPDADAPDHGAQYQQRADRRSWQALEVFLAEVFDEELAAH